MSEGIKRNLPNNQYKAAINADNPSSTNPFATKQVTDSLQQQINNISGDQSSQLYSGSAIWTGTGYVYDVTTASYRILGVNYTAAATQVTLSAADPINNRIDVIYADTNGNIGVIEGVASPNPVKPNVDGLQQIEITFIKVTANTTAPPGQTLETVYDENVEWTGTGQSAGGFVSFASTQEVYSGTVSTQISNFGGSASDNITYDNGSDYTMPNDGFLILRIRIAQPLTQLAQGLIVGFRDASGVSLGTGNALLGGNTSINYGFDPSLINQWQTVSIPLSVFGIEGIDVRKINIIRLPGFLAIGLNFFLDAIQIEDTAGNGGNPPTIGLALGELSDVNLTTPPTDGQVIVYNAVTQEWEAADQSSGAVDSVNGKTGPVVLDGTEVYLINNTGQTVTGAISDLEVSSVQDVVAGANTQVIIDVSDPTNKTAIISAFPVTTAGILDRTYFTADEITTSEGTFYLSNRNGKGTVVSASESTSVNDGEKKFFSQDLISEAYPINTTIYKGSYSGVINGKVDTNNGEQKFYIEIYKTDINGLPIPSGIAGQPVGDLGVTVIAIAESGLIDLQNGNETTFSVTAELSENLTLLTTNRVRYHVGVEKISTSGGPVLVTTYYGTDHISHIDLPVQSLTNTVINTDLTEFPNLATQYDINRFLKTNSAGGNVVKDTLENIIANPSKVTGEFYYATTFGGNPYDIMYYYDGSNLKLIATGEFVEAKQETTDPTVSDDATKYYVGKLWVNTTTNKMFVLVDGTTGAAVWKEIGGSGGGSGGGNTTVDNYHYQWLSNVDNVDFFNDGNVKFAYDSNGGTAPDFEVFMLTFPPNSNELEYHSELGGSVQNGLISQLNFRVDVFTSGVGPNERLEFIMAPSKGGNYPTYKMTAFRTGSVDFMSVHIQVINAS